MQNVPEDLFHYMGTQVRTKQNEEKGCFTSSTGVIILEKCNFLSVKEPVLSGISGSW